MDGLVEVDEGAVLTFEKFTNNMRILTENDYPSKVDSIRKLFQNQEFMPEIERLKVAFDDWDNDDTYEQYRFMELVKSKLMEG